MRSYKLVIVGNFRWSFYEKALLEGFQNAGHSARSYVIESVDLKTQVLSINHIRTVNRNFYTEIIKDPPDIILMYRVNEIFKSTLKRLHLAIPNVFIIGYHNDNPYKGSRNNIKYWNFLKNLPELDLVYVYRESNFRHALKRGAKNVRLLMPHYYSKLHLNHDIDLTSKNYDVVYVGHVEDDGRIEIMDYLFKNRVRLHIFGPGWDKVGRKKSWPAENIHGPVYELDYFEIISKSVITLCFFSKANDDVYTRRVFEIPAIGSILATQNSEFIQNTFVDQKDALIFRTGTELLEKILIHLSSVESIKKITINGHTKIVNNGNSESTRAIQIMEDYKELINA